MACLHWVIWDEIWVIVIYIYVYIYRQLPKWDAHPRSGFIWGFPEIGVPLNYPFLDIHEIGMPLDYPT